MTDWKYKAKEELKKWYQRFQGRQWDLYELDNDKNLLLAKICFAINGPPTVDCGNNDDLTMGYTAEERQRAQEILELIISVYKEVPARQFLVGIIFIACKQKDDIYLQPIFSVYAGGEPTEASQTSRRFVDLQNRCYKNWDDWKENNVLPPIKYAFPRYGYFSCSQSNEYEFDEEKYPNIEFGQSPQNTTAAKFLKATDVTTGITSLVSGGITIASLFTPVGPAVLLSSAIVGGASAAWGAGRAITRLFDKGQHSESMTDLESFTLYFSIAATPLHFTTSLVNTRLVQGAVMEGRIFSSSMRTFATILNFSTLGVDSVLIGCGLTNMIEKAKKKQLTTLDVLQFSMSVFFFTNTLVKPQTASGIIEKAQNEHILNYSNLMTDKNTKRTFDQFLNDNKASGTITDKSKIIRTINRIEDPNKIFKGLDGFNDIKIGGRKGRTLLVTDQNNHTNRINPNRINFCNVPLNDNVILNQQMLKDRLGTDPNNVKVKGKNIFRENSLNDGEIRRIHSIMANKKQTDVKLAIEVAERMGKSGIDDVLDLIEIVSADVSKRANKNYTRVNVAQDIRSNIDSYIAHIEKDALIAHKIAQKSECNFASDLRAVYHYRKHGHEFTSKLRAEPIEIYLKHLPENLIKDANLVQFDKFSSGDLKKIYVTNQDKFAVVIDSKHGHNLITLYTKKGVYNDFQQKLADSRSEAVKLPECVQNLSADIANIIGFVGAHFVLVLENNKRLKLGDLRNIL